MKCWLINNDKKTYFENNNHQKYFYQENNLNHVFGVSQFYLAFNFDFVTNVSK